MTKEFWRCAGIRALRTFAQAALAVIGTSAFFEINWVTVICSSLLAAVLSLLTSVATGLPEVEQNE